MALDPSEVPTADLPTEKTVSAYLIKNRLKYGPVLAVTVCGSTPAVATGTVTSMVADPSGTGFTGCVVPLLLGSDPMQEGFAGQTLVNTVDESTITTVASGAFTWTDFQAISPSARGTCTLTFSAPITTDLTGVAVQMTLDNSWHVPLQRQSRDGKTYTTTLPSADPETLAYMANLMGMAHVRAVLVVLEALGVQKTADEVAAAVAVASDNLESILASTFETIEEDRVAGRLPAAAAVDAGPIGP